MKETLNIRLTNHSQKNLSLEIKTEENIIQGDVFMSDLENRVTTLNRKVSPPGTWWYQLQRKISEDESNELHMDLMPGFKITWNYDQELVPEIYEYAEYKRLIYFNIPDQF